ncbi:DUF2267 domain-containing protein [Allosalinactinospora lopnorensis]|uniref:DUF2267 domain-containing protein n=1 Tax=Allosalinactinospora lopnorensis TaxID=1352348 RepID=UPI000623CB22|nr:DUF2267 domain-containing protein [Allosalinactinospora lopnorensis]
MSFTGVENLDRSIHKTNTWLADVAERFGTTDRQFTYRVVRAWLHTVRDRLSVNVAAHLAAGLPELLRGVFYDGWNPSRVPGSYDRDEFVNRFAREARVANADAPGKISVVSAVFRDHLGNGAFDNTLQQLPRDLRRLLGSEPVRHPSTEEETGR